MYGVCNISIIPMRAAPSEKAEMVSQLLFGEAYQIIEEKENWICIKTTDCHYSGWINAKMHNPLHEKDVDSYLKAEKYVVKDFLLLIKDFESGISFPIFIGSSFPYPENGMLILGRSVFVIDIPENSSSSKEDQAISLLRFASSYLNAPYLWGGRSPAGIDCSGLVQLAYKSIGHSLPRDASQQVGLGTTVDFINEMKVGDVAFFHNEEDHIVHTGIICGPNKILHASGKVRIDILDQTGIFNKEVNKYTHFLRVIKRFLFE